MGIYIRHRLDDRNNYEEAKACDPNTEEGENEGDEVNPSDGRRAVVTRILFCFGTHEDCFSVIREIDERKEGAEERGEVTIRIFFDTRPVFPVPVGWVKNTEEGKEEKFPSRDSVIAFDNRDRALGRRRVSGNGDGFHMRRSVTEQLQRTKIRLEDMRSVSG